MERDEAFASLERLVADALTGKGRVALVTGAVGTGKSELLHAFAERVAELGALAVMATASRVEQDLPLGVMGQLIQDAPLTAEERERALALLAEGAASVAHEPDGDNGGEILEQVDAQVVHALCTVLLELSERYPLVIVVDDVHLSDRLSLLCLAYLSRRVRFARVAAVFGHSDHGRYTETIFQTELLRQPHCRRVHLDPLSPAGVTAVVAERLGEDEAVRHGSTWYDLSGGNPLLVGALIEDQHPASRSGEPDEPVVGDRYGQAVLSCLHRGEPQALHVARGLAVLGDPESLGMLLGVGSATVSQSLHSLTAAGLLALGGFRHEVARAAVLAELEPRERMDLYRRAAELAHDAGASTTDIADHLLQAGRIEAPWVVPVLEDAARNALREGRVKPAVSYLQLAWRECADEQHRMRIMTMLVRAEWRINPGAPAGHLAELTDAMQRGNLRGSDAVVLARALLWHGRTVDAREVLEGVSTAAEDVDGETSTELAVVKPWLRCTYPPFLAEMRGSFGTQNRSAIISVAASRRLEATLALAEVLTKGPREQLIEGVDRILRGCRLDEMSMDTVESALLALTYAGRQDKAVPWCDLFSVEASSRHAPSRQARLAAIRAEMAVRQGDMPGAEHHARLAMEIIPLTSWGVAVGGPLSSLIMAATAMGDHDAVHEHLDQPVPDAMFETRYGLHYLYARGRYSLATDHPTLALRDFQLCGELIRKWDLDVPGLIPWRVDAAEACLRSGRPEQAQQLIEGQLRRCGPATPRVHGMAMRLLAATGEVRHRPMLLRQAAELLQTSGDRYELARALLDLVEAYQALGEYRRAGMIAGRALSVAKECHAEPLSRTLFRDGGDDKDDAEVPASMTTVLSDAERRVAVLAAAGYTNREIAGKLYITISTVEQHLTRTYRKLNISRRADLPPSLEFGGAVTT
ncbi:LuxR family transcriptional regulator [Spongiactinospora sp. TRM90649]|uniref:helix-turn-helix transcriptional regulator n=1 Tax=Spongiactinospora sp. TRM90649 TaxID=3031114 RepID=UPI0023F76FD4|nr:LuxR family transcriptional regulator [Spongiactinospora sp. TRM90649]MDF5757178.1 AAA family ATPase [Spongiactinospora sp. TRM90649]